MTEKEKSKAYDRLAATLKATSPAKLKTLMVKSSTVIMRTTPADKADMEHVASQCKLSVTEYLTRLHCIASSILQHGGK